ncbi:iron-containing alcohol dehydrogenase [Bacteroidota bacterium]
MKNFILHIPTKIIYGKRKISSLTSELPSNTKNILIVTDKVISEKTDILTKIESSLEQYKIIVFNEVEANPSYETVGNGAALSKENNVDFVIGLGGGSSMDAAKGIAVAAANSKSIKEYVSGEAMECDPLPVVCLPTTSGTGSEVTPFAVFSDNKNKTKNGFANDKIFPIFSIIDPELTYSMPESVTLYTGLDVLTHALEAYLSTESFELNDQYALKAAEIVIDNLPEAAKNNFDAMDRMAYASMLAGVAITHASTILPHIMGYPLTVYHNIPHGLASVLTFPAFIDYLKEYSLAADKVKQIDRLFIKYGGIKQFIEQLGVSANLSEYKIKKSEIDNFVSKTIVKGDVQITPGNVTADVIYKIFEKSFI